MLPDSAFWFLLIVFILIESLVVVLMVALYKLFSRYEDLRVSYDEKLMQADAQAEEVLAKAEREAQYTMESARMKAQKLVTDAEGFGEQGSKRLEEALDWMLQDQTRTYTEQLKQAREKTEEQLLSMTGEINQLAKGQLQAFALELQQQTKEAQEEAQAMIKEAYERMGQEVERYKRERMRRVDQIVKQIVLDVARDVMGKSLTQADHEALVMKALEEAKQSEVFE